MIASLCKAGLHLTGYATESKRESCRCRCSGWTIEYYQRDRQTERIKLASPLPRRQRAYQSSVLMLYLQVHHVKPGQSLAYQVKPFAEQACSVSTLYALDCKQDSVH